MGEEAAAPAATESGSVSAQGPDVSNKAANAPPGGRPCRGGRGWSSGCYS